MCDINFVPKKWQAYVVIRFGLGQMFQFCLNVLQSRQASQALASSPVLHWFGFRTKPLPHEQLCKLMEPIFWLASSQLSGVITYLHNVYWSTRSRSCFLNMLVINTGVRFLTPAHFLWVAWIVINLLFSQLGIFSSAYESVIILYS